MISEIRTLSSLLSVLLLSSAALAAGESTAPASGASASPAPPADETARRARIVLDNEATIDSLRAPIAELTRSIQNLALPGERARPIFAQRVMVVDLAGSSTSERTIVDIDAHESSWKVGKPERRDARSLALWADFLSKVDYFEHSSFYTIRGSFAAGDPALFHSPSGFKATARMKNGELAWVRASLDLDWRRTGADRADKNPVWKIEAFKTTGFDVIRAPATLYTEVTNDALSAADRAAAQRSLRDEFLVGWVRGIRSKEIDLDVYMADFLGTLEDGSERGNWAHTSVVDFDRDGWDDIYVMHHDAPALRRCSPTSTTTATMTRSSPSIRTKRRSSRTRTGDSP
jgi:hypothetical protein